MGGLSVLPKIQSLQNYDNLSSMTMQLPVAGSMIIILVCLKVKVCKNGQQKTCNLSCNIVAEQVE